jgi:hypothetical protein
MTTRKLTLIALVVLLGVIIFYGPRLSDTVKAQSSFWLSNDGGQTIFTNASRVGIGTTEPGVELLPGTGVMHVAGTASAYVLEAEDNGQERRYTISLSSGGKLAIKDSLVSGPAATRFVVDANGNVGIGARNPQAKLDVAGNATFADQVSVPVLQITGGSDLSEQFDIRSNQTDLLPSPGMVACIDYEHPGELVICGQAYDRTVAGIVSGAGGVKPGMLMGQADSEANGTYPVALTGRVYVWADASSNPIQPGDLLTTSDNLGHAMKVADYERAQGAILGKAMSSLNEGQGLVLVLISLQ